MYVDTEEVADGCVEDGRALDVCFGAGGLVESMGESTTAGCGG
jgi:hypothetical protein